MAAEKPVAVNCPCLGCAEGDWTLQFTGGSKLLPQRAWERLKAVESKPCWLDERHLDSVMLWLLALSSLRAVAWAFWKTSAWGKALRSHRVSWGSHLAFMLGILEFHSHELKSQVEKGDQVAWKGSEEKKLYYYVLKPCMYFLNLWNSLPGVRKGVNSRLVIPLLRGGQACTLGALIQSIVNLIILPLPTGMVSMAGDAVNMFDAGFVTPAFWKSSADGAEQTAPCASHQEWLQHVPRTSHHPCHTLGKGGTAVSDNWASLAGPESSPDGCCHMFISSHGFQAIRVINHNWKKKKSKPQLTASFPHL